MKILSSLIILVAIISCSTNDSKALEPSCLADQVTYFTENEACNSDASVREYEFQEEVVYVFDRGNCLDDAAHPVVNYDCDTIGYLEGFAGITKINGEEFFGNAEFVSTLFEN
ncbi:MAG: hypothetical protein ACI8ZM_003534 [Crocinitomix sp.]|jgi:hypothetical protein